MIIHCFGKMFIVACVTISGNKRECSPLGGRDFQDRYPRISKMVDYYGLERSKI